MPYLCTRNTTGCSAVRLAHLVWDQRVPGSNPGIPTERDKKLSLFFFVVIPEFTNRLIGQNFLICNKKREELSFFSSVPPQIVLVMRCAPTQVDFCTSVVWLWSRKNVAFTDSLKMMRQYRVLDLLNTLYMCYLQCKHNITILNYQVNSQLSARHYQLYYITMVIIWLLLLFMVNTH